MIAARLFIVAMAAAALVGCKRPAESSAQANAAFVVDTLFTHDECTVYRFYDSGHPRYFTNCAGAAAWQEGCGKNCQRETSVLGWSRGESKHPASTRN